MSADLDQVIHSRKFVRRQITQIYGNVGEFPSYDEIKKSVVKSKLADLSERLEKLNHSVQSLMWVAGKGEDAIDNEFEVCESYADKINFCRANFSALPVNSTSIPSPSNTGQSQARSLLRCPVAPLPFYSGTATEDLSRFLNQFEATIARFQYPEYDKLLLLKQQLKGRALTLVDSLEVGSQSYVQAVSLLRSAFDSAEVRKFEIIKQLSEINLCYDADPYEFISKYRKLAEAVSSLKISVQSFLQFYFWSGLNENFKTHFVQLTNKTRPSIEELNSRFFEVCERYHTATNVLKVPGRSDQRNKIHSKTNESSYAARVDISTGKSEKVRKCSLCSVDSADCNHATFQCPVYKDSIAKLEKIRNSGGCERCGNMSHVTKKCAFRFKRKCRCGKWHFSFLCSKVSINVTAIEDPKPEDDVPATCSVVSNVATENSSGILSSRSVLPTFTCLLNDSLKIRGLRDLGSQNNFIKLEIADRCNLKILQNGVKLKVTGFNSSKEFCTKIVEMPIVIGNKSYNIPAICTNEFNINLKLSGLSSVAKKFVSKNYKLADERLLENTDQIKDLDFVLGTKSAFCLKTNEVCFGERSMYADSDIGVLLLGDLSQMSEDLQNLPDKSANKKLSKRKKYNKKSGKITESNQIVSVAATDCFVEVNDNFAVMNDNSFEDITYETSVNFLVVDSNGKINDKELDKAATDVLSRNYFDYMSSDCEISDGHTSETNAKLIKFSLDSAERSVDGRLQMPLLWNPATCNSLSSNKSLALAVLESNRRKLSKKDEFLNLMDQTFKTQKNDGIIERIDNIDKFLSDHPKHSFLCHMGVFKLGRETTKCRVVFLSNLSQGSGSRGISHNQAMFSGPSLNTPIASALLNLRFGKFLLVYDLCKAFNQILLSENDQNKLLFFWHRNVSKNDFTPVLYRNVRLSFGLRCSPFILMISLYKILVIDAIDDNLQLRNLKSLLYQLLYMDNGGILADTECELMENYSKLNAIYNPYKFYLQQFSSNSSFVQERVDLDTNKDEATPNSVKLLGAIWDRGADMLSAAPINLDIEANTKRLVLKTVAAQYDVYNLNAPVMNRSRLFLHNLQCNKDLAWDTILPAELLKEWRNITKQANSAPTIRVSRCVGSLRDTYDLVACTDASKVMYGVVLYLYNVQTKVVSFVRAKNRIVNTKLFNKSIPSLELQAIVLGVQTLMELYADLSGDKCMFPVSIRNMVVYTDSLVSLHWLDSSVNKIEKMNKKSVFVNNRLSEIERLCHIHPVSFQFISGIQNPADCVTRQFSYKQLTKTNYLAGPDMQQNFVQRCNDLPKIVVPNPEISTREDVLSMSSLQQCVVEEPLIQRDRFSSFSKYVRVYEKVMSFVNKLKLKINAKKGKVSDENHNSLTEAKLFIIREEQKLYFAEVFKYWSSNNKLKSSMPELVSKFNVYPDEFGLLRVRSKFDRPGLNGDRCHFPILLPKQSVITKLIIREVHEKLNHIGCYALMSELRKQFYIVHYFSVLKKVLKQCVVCKRFNGRSLSVNQSPYRDIRVNPPQIVFRNVYIDHMGPFFTRVAGSKVKCWILCITCMWSRAVNLKVCMDLTTDEFLRALQLHFFQYGIAQTCISDHGTQIIKGGNIIEDFLKDVDSVNYLRENGINSLKFEQYCKGKSELGSLVEVCVKFVKRLIYGAVRNNVLSHRNFEFLVEETVHIINRRPVAFKEALGELSDDVPEPITPERLIHGYDLPSVSIIPNLRPDNEEDPDYSPQEKIKSNMHKFVKVRECLLEKYNEEFLANLIKQAIDDKSRYTVVNHGGIATGDIVLIKEDHTKAQNFPMAIVKSVEVNVNGEVTNAWLKKGKTSEIIQRHATSIIPLLRLKTDEVSENDRVVTEVNDTSRDRPPRRATAVSSQRITRQLLANGSV